MTASELRKKYLKFFTLKGHAIIPSASLIPENDPTTLFITAGMHPLVPYLTGEKHPQGKRLVDVQKCIRTVDIDDVGDNRHLTFFEMLGNWSLGGYFKKEAIEWSWEFMVSEKWLGLDPKRIYITVFAGDAGMKIEKDEESIKLWQEQFKKVGIKTNICEINEKAKSSDHIFLLGKKDNFWGPVGKTGPCGPCTEMFYDVRPEEGELAGTHSELVENFRLMEFWNDVFMEYNKKTDGSYEKLSQKNVDTGMGLERMITLLSGKENIFDTELFEPIIKKIKELSEKKYNEDKGIERSMRIIADHIKAAVFIISDEIVPSNVQQGYVLRRLIRQAIRQGHLIGIKENFIVEIAKVVQEIYKEIYSEILDEKILSILEEEENKFRKTLEKGLKEFEKIIKDISGKNISGKVAFNLYQTYGFPIELTKEIAEERNIAVDEKEFNKELQKHRELSRTASIGMFKGGLADAGEISTRYHTATHLLLAALREILGPETYQRGSNINAERLRFDFNYSQKLTQEQIKKIEDLVNQKIQENILVEMVEMPKKEALKITKISFDPMKYGEKVKVYKIGDFSIELCGGPHVTNTGKIGKFKIIKEESSSAGVRRIKAIVE